MSQTNPFKPTRFEHDQHPLIWLSPKVRRLEMLKSVYVSGTRGSGKTTLLKAVNWRERMYNTVLRDQIRSVLPGYLSVYFRLPDYFTNSISRIRWDKYYSGTADVETLSFEYFSTVVESIALQLVCEAMSTLRAEGHFNYSIEEEYRVVSSALKSHPELVDFLPKSIDASLPIGLAELGQAFQSIHRQMNSAATRGYVDRIVSSLPQNAGGDLLQRFGEAFTSLIHDSPKSKISQDFHIKLCIDDCEVLRPVQQRFMNTLVRKARAPIFWIVSYVGQKFESTSTLIPDQNLTDADRFVLDLDTESDQGFFELCQAVSSLRLHYAAEKEPVPVQTTPGRQFDLRRILGPTDINHLFMMATKRTESDDLRRLKNRAEAMMSEIISTFEGQGENSFGEHEAHGAPPIYQTYVIDRLYPKLSASEVRARTRINFGAYMRRKQRAALLAMCSEFRVSNIPYAGWHVVLSMSDGCIRDFLEIMGEIYEIATRGDVHSIHTFKSRYAAIPWNVQRRAILTASTAKFVGIKESTATHWAEASKLVECLGRLTSLLQGDHTSLDCLKTPERGVFVFDLDQVAGATEAERQDARDLVRAVLHRCEADGLLRPYLERRPDKLAAATMESAVMHYRLHRRFAAHFRYSYRGPYEEVKLPMDDVVALCRSPDILRSQDWVSKVYGRMSQSDQKQGKLDLS